MAKENSFDIVSQVNMQEVNNAIQQAMKEIANRYDFKGSQSHIALEGNDIVILSDDEYKLEQVKDVLASKLVRRGVSLKSLDYQKIEPAAGGTVRQRARIKQGIAQDVAKQISKLIRDSGLKVRTQIQGDQMRVFGKSRDELQKVIQMLKQADLPIDLQFVNYR
ncbi:MAG: YajQ family cyclic di-GMP-binding protein [Bacillaceae bacterium G1]|nr:YajQ family cyclic di-GMP-binding protein [Bacillota bacterium]OJF16779.1 MAG: YajQ family cyclic di-GMP-binding protein [Bacillaceae bacterium G1]